MIISYFIVIVASFQAFDWFNRSVTNRHHNYPKKKNPKKKKPKNPKTRRHSSSYAMDNSFTLVVIQWLDDDVFVCVCVTRKGDLIISAL